MDRNEAKLLLQACRPNGQDDSAPAFVEALALADRDPELREWWQARRLFDQKVSAKLQQIRMPADLRATILAGHKIERMTPRFHLPYWIAAAALVMVGIGLGMHFQGASSTPKSVVRTDFLPALMTDDFKDHSLAFLSDDTPSHGMTSSDHDQVAAWLRQQGSPVGAIPAKMASLPSVGCETFAMHGHTVSMICFSLADGGYAHLFMIDKEAIADPPGSTPEIKKSGAWSMAFWSDGKHAYMLATLAGADELKKLL